MDYAKIKFELEDGVAVVTLNDPTTLNAAGHGMGRELIDALQRVSGGQTDARAVVLTGEGRGFCSGVNLAPAPGESAEAGNALEKVFNPLVRLMRDLPVPFVTAVNGPAAGVGCSFALMGDLIVAAESAYFLQAFRKIGLVPDGGSTYLLPRMIGRARAMEMALLGEKLPARRALEWGLINRCVPDAELMQTALSLAKELAQGPKSLGLIRRIMWDSLDAHWQEQLGEEVKVQREAGATEDFREGVRAFLEKRPARFKGR